MIGQWSRFSGKPSDRPLAGLPLRDRQASNPGPLPSGAPPWFDACLSLRGNKLRKRQAVSIEGVQGESYSPSGNRLDRRSGRRRMSASLLSGSPT